MKKVDIGNLSENLKKRQVNLMKLGEAKFVPVKAKNEFEERNPKKLPKIQIQRKYLSSLYVMFWQISGLNVPEMLICIYPTHLASDMVRYCQILLDIVIYCPILSDIV